MVTATTNNGTLASQDRVTAAHKIARLTDEIASSQDARSLTDLARTLSFPKSTVGDLCSSLAEQSLLQRVADGRYKLGVRFVELIDELVKEKGLVQLLAAQVRGSIILSGLTVFLSMAHDDADLILEVIHGADPLPLTPYPGLRSTSDGVRETNPELGVTVAEHADGMTVVESPISRGAATAPPVWVTAMLPRNAPSASVREVSTALLRLATTLSVHGGATFGEVAQ
ncbi:helix-turn-helix domain-containing protein [Microbacterium aerolatum]|uniref:HTH iclR-type domain-containing protein n=1 Tax=Microbacterium aerolatum TaxID=153731 RepID=A0A511ABZ5_9MICO|nr:helix-turn-helix domain-containing protein [Microbacterium aerolatum]GEK85675.1 hypothetical protein MAE01_08510 [Microbacterium aerolatum]GGB21270.1 hypothetical protein GCM10007198_09660 [Microbacterium aerolatum]